MLADANTEKETKRTKGAEQAMPINQRHNIVPRVLGEDLATVITRFGRSEALVKQREDGQSTHYKKRAQKNRLIDLSINCILAKGGEAKLVGLGSSQV